jgi:hypothetical protein
VVAGQRSRQAVRDGEAVTGGRPQCGEAATIDRYLAPVKAKDHVQGKSTAKSSPLLRSSVKIRKATDEIKAPPGFFGVTQSRIAGQHSKTNSPGL